MFSVICIQQVIKFSVMYPFKGFYAGKNMLDVIRGVFQPVVSVSAADILGLKRAILRLDCLKLKLKFKYFIEFRI